MFYSIVSALFRMCFRAFFTVEITGMENIPKSGKLILCSNHKTILDPLFYMAFFPRQPFFMGKDAAFKNYFIGSFLKRMGAFPVARGQRDEKAIEKALSILQEEKVLGMFPEGKRVQENQAGAKKGIGKLALAVDAPLIPAALVTNFELFSKVRCKIGKVINISKNDYQELSNDVYYRVSNEVLNTIYRMAADDESD
ncbi:MAG: 1-acyl-sn-glycerol-3-phosphate acyltransferase [Candidatus Riflebacteria bacterium]|nr:1-acyl-sn-glycerol-3-phosphate acyltransferase [Candidatus Riflebacteria bacterium]